MTIKDFKKYLKEHDVPDTAVMTAMRVTTEHGTGVQRYWMETAGKAHLLFNQKKNRLEIGCHAITLRRR
jgi:hypothetical protein